VEDSIAIGGYMALSFAEGFLIDPLYTDLLDELPHETVDVMFNRAVYESKKKTEVKINTKDSLKKKVSYSPSKNYYKNTASVLRKFKESMSLFHGSNSWVLSGKRTNTAMPILASDPHVAYAVPGIWFEAHIKSPTYENYGHYLPALPFPGLGHNSFRAWGITMSNSDDLDFYKETFKESNSDLVKFKGKFVKVKKEKEIIKIKNEPDHIEEVVYTPHGPIIDNTKFVKKGNSLSVRWSYLEPNNNPLLTFYLLSQSRELSDLAPALSHAAAPGFNLTFADSKGNIGWHVMGKIPIRNRPGNGNMVLDGASGLDEYKGHLDIMDNPHLYNPESGVIVSANYKHQFEGKVPWIGPWQPKNRYLRIHEALSKKEIWSLKELKNLQTEQKVTFLDETVHYFLKNLKSKNPLHKSAIELMKQWDGTSNKDSVEPSIYYSMFQLVTKFAVEDELGVERFKTYLQGADGSHFFANIKHTKDSAVWDDITTKEIKETQIDIFQKDLNLKI
jgi:penicillin amidase